ncbi:MAG TPA: acyl-CoA dehydrogenase family protein, partial [Advenella sp.]|nr:acyl-CoA dehydrogenase family protein [Advenella sp.]
MDFTLSEETEQLRVKIRRFVDDVLIPLEKQPDAYDEHENIAPALLKSVQQEARAQGLWSLQMPVARGGRG